MGFSGAWAVRAILRLRCVRAGHEKLRGCLPRSHAVLPRGRCGFRKHQHGAYCCFICVQSGRSM